MLIENRISSFASLPLAIFLSIGLGCSSDDGDNRDAEPATSSHNGPSNRDNLTARPLVSPRGATGALFEVLSSRTTGVDFVNVLHPENNVPYIYMGAGVATADYDQDGRPDIYLLSVDGANKLYRQIGEFQFQDVTDVAGVNGGEAWSRGATFFDADNDGDLDLYVCNTEAPNLLYVNQGDGTFVEAAKEFGVDFVGASVMAGVADYDRDGDLDLYIVTHRPLHYSVKGKLLDQLCVPTQTRKTRAELKFDYRFRTVNGQKIPTSREDFFENLNHWEIAGQSDALLRNNGNGTFTNVTEAAGLRDHGLGLSSTWLDFDGDGWLDLHVANDLQTKDRLYRNNQDGTFTLATQSHLPHTTWYSMGSDFGDINNDGLFDFLVVDMASTTHYRSKLQMGDMGQFRYFMEGEWPPQLMRNALYLNTGSRRYMEIAKMSGLDASDWTWAVKLADLDNDGWVDAYFTNGIARADEMNPDLKSEVSSLMREEGADAVARIVRTQEADATANLAFRNQGNLSFEEVSAAWGLNLEGISYGAANADFDGDGDLDLVVNNHNGRATIYRNQSDQGHRVVFYLRGVVSNRFGIGAKVTLESASGIQVRQLFPVHGYMTSDEPIVHFGLGSDEIIDHLVIDWPSGHRQAFEDLPVDHAFTITESKAQPPALQPPASMRTPFVDCTAATGLTFKHQEFTYNDFGVQPLLPGKLSQLGPGLAWGDCDNDGDEDLFVGGAAGQAGALFENLGNGSFAQVVDGPWQADELCEDMAPLWFDVDSDDDLDLFVTSGSSEYDPGDERLENRLYLNDGRGGFRAADPELLPARAGCSSAVAAADFDQDGDLDLFVGERFISGQYPLAPNCQLLRNDNGRFHDVTDEVAPELRKVGLVTSALWSDADGDGHIDLLIAVEWGPIKLFRNDDGRLVESTVAAGLAKRSGWWNSLAGGDFDADGDIDYVALNAGLNTKYGSPTAEKPSLLYYGDMDNSGEMNLVEVKSGDRGLLPVRGLSCSSSAMPVLSEKFTTFHSFASSVLTDIYAPQRLESAHRFVVNELASGLLINDGEAHFTWQPLPRIAQAAPGYGATVCDLDGDGNVDIYFVQNLFSREPETGAWDGGTSMFLRGNGDGEFQPVSSAETGLIVAGDAKGMAIADIDRDGWPDIVAAQNDDTMRVFRNQGIEGRRCIAIRLRGPRGNRDACGARVMVRLPNNRCLTAEVYAGSGYLSQSAPSVFLGNTGLEKALEVDVRWPDGARTTHSVQATESQVIIEHPALSGE